jgi:hypothetical protein
MTAKMDLTAEQAAASLMHCKLGNCTAEKRVLPSGKTSDPVSGASTVSLSNVSLPTVIPVFIA